MHKKLRYLCYARYKLKKDTRTQSQQNKLSLTHIQPEKEQTNEQFVWHIYQKNNKISDTQEHTLKCINV